MLRSLPLIWGITPAILGASIPRQLSNPSLNDCPGYSASNVVDSGSSVTADLSLAGTACNIYGEDLKDLRLQVEYETGEVYHSSRHLSSASN